MANLKGLLPANLTDLLETGAKKTNQDIIIDYLISEPGAITLTDKQTDLLERWSYCDDLLRSRKHTHPEMVKLLMNKFNGISAPTARNDIENAKLVFGSTIKVSRNYVLANHLNRLEDAMTRAEVRGDTKAAAQLYSIYNDAIKLQKDESKSTPPPTAIIFGIYGNAQVLPEDYTESDALKTTQDFLHEKGITDIDFEIVS
jgi:hypothetical protein